MKKWQANMTIATLWFIDSDICYMHDTPKAASVVSAIVGLLFVISALLEYVKEKA